MFSVSDPSKNKDKTSREYLEYFEDLNKEIIERQNSKMITSL